MGSIRQERHQPTVQDIWRCRGITAVTESGPHKRRSLDR